MYEPEEPDEPTPPAMERVWVFDELEAEFEEGLRREAEQEAVAAVRAEVGATVLLEQLARRLGSPVVMFAGARVLRGSAVASYPEFLLLRDADGAEHLVRYAVTVSVALPAEPVPLGPTPGPAVRRFRFALALRELARWREPVRVQLVDGAVVGGTINAVGSVYLEVTEHDPAEARRRAAVRARRFVGFAAVVAVVAVSLPPGRR